jgi:NTE family protein
MAIKNFLFFLKRPELFFICFVLVGCSTLKTRDSIRSTAPPRLDGVPEALRPSLPQEEAPEAEDKQPPPEVARFANPKIGLILGPGSARALAHIGVVQELAKAKLPITHVVGLEIGALVGAIYSQKGQPFDVEWQISKLKDLKSLGPFIQGIFGSTKTEDLKVSFSCPAYNLAKSQYFMMNRGLIGQMLPYCLSAPPMLKPYNHNVAAVSEVRAAIDYLKSKGANYIVYVHVLQAKNGLISGGLEDEDNLFWTFTALSISRQWQAADFVITVPVQDFDLKDWSHRREIIQKGIEAGQNASSQISKRLGL